MSAYVTSCHCLDNNIGLPSNGTRSLEEAIAHIANSGGGMSCADFAGRIGGSVLLYTLKSLLGGSCWGSTEKGMLGSFRLLNQDSFRGRGEVTLSRPLSFHDFLP